MTHEELLMVQCRLREQGSDCVFETVDQILDHLMDELDRAPGAGGEKSEWVDPRTDRVPDREGPVLCYFKDTGNYSVCWYSPPVLVRQACFMLDGDEVYPTAWQSFKLI